VLVARWDPGAQDRLRRAALDLYRERGFDGVTASQVAERAGLARRTFFRYFADTREVLFAGSEQLPPAVAAAVRAADPRLGPLDAAVAALAVVGARLAEAAEQSGQAPARRAVIAASPELQERERTKLAGLSAALAGALEERGSERRTATLLAPVTVAVFATAFERWTDHAGDTGFTEVFAGAVGELRAALDAPARSGRTQRRVRG